MKNLSIRNKILSVSLIPSILMVALIAWGFLQSAQKTSEAMSLSVSQSLLSMSQDSVKNNVEIAVSAIKHLYEESDGSAEAKKQAADILRNISFDEGNYIFVLDFDGNYLAYNPDVSQEGRNLLKHENPDVVKLVRNLIDIGKSGTANGFHQYRWNNPATNQVEPKLSYVQGLSKWGWALGAGVYMNHVNDEVVSIQEQVNEINNEFLIIQFVIVTIALGLISMIAAVVSNIIAKPIRGVAKAMENVAGGDLTMRIDIDSKDEIGQFSERFNSVMDKIHEVLQGVHNSANSLSDSAADLNNISQKTYHAISQQDQETNLIAGSVESMSDSAREIAENGNIVKTSANDAEQKSREGAQAVQGNLTSVKMLADDITQAADAVSAVEKRTSEIQAMLEVIHSVTEQTNLLALNAAIEAARAGEQGRGFAVVADEVRSLAMRSADSAEEIRKIIEGLTADTQSAVATMNKSKARSEENFERTKVVADSLQVIEASVQSILEKSAFIAGATDEQHTMAQDIASNVSRIKEISANSSSEMRQTTQASDNLNRLSQNLLNNIEFFKFN